MAGETDSALLLSALLAELDQSSRVEQASANGLAAVALDHARWGLSYEAEQLRHLARHHQVNALLAGGKAEAWRARFASSGSSPS